MTEFIADMTLAEGLGQVCGLVALGFCIAGFANKNDDRLMVLLISANVAFALMFAFFESWTASALTGSSSGRACYCRLARPRSCLMHASARMLYDVLLYRAHARAPAQTAS